MKFKNETCFCKVFASVAKEYKLIMILIKNFKFLYKIVTKDEFWYYSYDFTNNTSVKAIETTKFTKAQDGLTVLIQYQNYVTHLLC